MQVLQALQHGSKQQPRLMLGADGIANMKAAKSATPATKLDLWVRASLNEQLLGVRVSTLLVNPHALKPWYHPQALLLQHGPMAGVMQELQELSQFRFALPVDAAAGVLVGPSVATVGQKAGNTIQQQQQQQQGQVAGSAIGSGDASGKKALSAAGAAASGSNSSRSSSMAAALDPRKYFGSFSAGLGSLRSSSTTAQASAAVTAAAGSSGSNAASSSNPAIPTFLWGAAPGTPGSSGTTTPAATAPAAAAAPAAAGSIGAAGATAATAAATAVTAATAATGGFFRRRRVPAIKEVRVPAPGSGAVLSREPSSTLSPMSTEDETAYAGEGYTQGSVGPCSEQMPLPLGDRLIHALHTSVHACTDTLECIRGLTSCGPPTLVLMQSGGAPTTAHRTCQQQWQRSWTAAVAAMAQRRGGGLAAVTPSGLTGQQEASLAAAAAPRGHLRQQWQQWRWPGRGVGYLGLQVGRAGLTAK